MLSKIVIPISILSIASQAAEQNKHKTGSIYPSYKGLIIAGYQGWFDIEDGQIFPDETRIRIDMWPDVSEYEKTYPTGLKYVDGKTARFFNSADKSTIDLHFKWMKEYGVDGVFMQRFFKRTINPGTNDESVIILKHAFEAASKMLREEIPVSIDMPVRSENR